MGDVRRLVRHHHILQPAHVDGTLVDGELHDDRRSSGSRQLRAGRRRPRHSPTVLDRWARPGVELDQIGQPLDRAASLVQLDRPVDELALAFLGPRLVELDTRPTRPAIRRSRSARAAGRDRPRSCRSSTARGPAPRRAPRTAAARTRRRGTSPAGSARWECAHRARRAFPWRSSRLHQHLVLVAEHERVAVDRQALHVLAAFASHRIGSEQPGVLDDLDAR